MKYPTVERVLASSVQIKEFPAGELVGLINRYKLHNDIDVDGSMVIQYGWDGLDGMAVVGWRDEKPVGWMMLSRVPEGPDKAGKAYFQRYVAPDYRGKDLSMEMAKVLFPRFQQAHPDLRELVSTRDPKRFLGLWRSPTVESVLAHATRAEADRLLEMLRRNLPQIDVQLVGSLVGKDTAKDIDLVFKIKDPTEEMLEASEPFWWPVLERLDLIPYDREATWKNPDTEEEIGMEAWEWRGIAVDIFPDWGDW
jgi:GNAT superfamily N-acetyltransferase